MAKSFRWHFAWKPGYAQRKSRCRSDCGVLIVKGDKVVHGWGKFGEIRLEYTYHAVCWVKLAMEGIEKWFTKHTFVPSHAGGRKQLHTVDTKAQLNRLYALLGYYRKRKEMGNEVEEKLMEIQGRIETLKGKGANNGSTAWNTDGLHTTATIPIAATISGSTRSGSDTPTTA